jgi:hypothetical protein
MVAEALPADKIATVRLLPRGDWMNPGEVMQPAFPEFLAGKPPADGKRLTRLDLANWLMSAENPLPARQFTNRLWQQFFGRGLSSVLDDLGSQGEMPSHPELLDWLASEFRESGWDVKHMVRLVVTSRPISAKPPPDLPFLQTQGGLHFSARAKRVIHLCMAGGPSQLESFDPSRSSTPSTASRSLLRSPPASSSPNSKDANSSRAAPSPSSSAMANPASKSPCSSRTSAPSPTTSA